MINVFQIEIEFLKQAKKEILQKLYYHQYLPYLNEHGDRIIYINSICKSFIQTHAPFEDPDNDGEMDWKHHFYVIDDGGFCFWKVQINIDNLTYSRYSVNAH